ncbi:MAG: OmpA family protein, partial [Paludibacteraceae bacterium]|nr:OmpA family protein [Paludibacteraceae bacterium]
MQVTLHKLFKASTAGLKLVAMALIMFVNVFYTRAQINDASVRLTFPFDSPVLNRNYMSNSSAMAELDSLVAKIADGESISVVTFSSPEGNFAYNQALSTKRAESVRSYIVSKYPALAGRIVVNAGAESWDELRRSVMSDARLSSYARTQVLEIVDSNKEADAKESLLKAIPAYKSLYNNFFRGLRYAEISLRIKNLAATAPQHTNAAVSESKNASANGEPIVYYSLSEDFIRPGYMNNVLNMKEIRRILSNPENRQNTIVIEGAASPEGPVSINTRLGIARAENLANWIIGQFPDMEGKVVVRSKGEDWDGLANSIAACESLDATQKQELLDIIASGENANKKEALLKAHPAYSTVDKDCLPYIRYARIAGLENAYAREAAQ